MEDVVVRVVLIEDNPGDRALVSDHLRRTGLVHELVVWGTIRAAVEWAQTGGRADVVLLDMHLPDGSGITALGRVAQAFPSAPIVVLTGHEDEHLPRACLESGASDYLQKDELRPRSLRRAIEYADLRARAAQLRSQLEHAERLVSVGEIAAGVAHEINNPAAYVLANISEMEHCVTDGCGCGMDTLLATVRDGVERIVRVSADLLRFARNSSEHAAERLDANDLCRRSVAMVNNRVRHSARLETDLQATQPLVGNTVRIGQVLVNLLLNAANAVEEAGGNGHRVVVATKDLDGWVEISVADTGNGIAVADQSRLFEPFFTTRPDAGGTGLGLSICHEIVTSMGGAITFDSTPGEGTVFRVRLPRSDSRAEPVEEPSPSPGKRQHRGRKLLLIDDEEQLRRALSTLLGRHHHVVQAEDAAVALTRLDSDEPFDAIVCDLMMPGIDGVGFLREVRERFPQYVPCTGILTGGATTPAARSYLKRTNVPVLAKPATASQLLEFVEALACRPATGVEPAADPSRQPEM